jgi:indole-3-glycerol phosphate synthase
MSVLEKIVTNKQKEIAFYKEGCTISRFEKEGFFWSIRNQSLVASLQIPGGNGIIAEFKRKSPSKGVFKTKDIEVEPVIRVYNKYAAGISVLTDEEFFGGDLDDLVQAKVIAAIPVLRKDFIIDQWQIAESKAFGADVILLIAACLSPEEVRSFATYARSIGLETILEIHGENELDHYCDEVDMIGINNRNLQTFEVNLDTCLQLAQKIPAGKPLIAESGIHEAKTILTLRAAGFSGFLIGEQFMKQDDPGQAFQHFISELILNNN